MATKKRRRKLQRSSERFVADLEKRGELNPRHRRDFDQLLDVVVPPPTKKK